MYAKVPEGEKKHLLLCTILLVSAESFGNNSPKEIHVKLLGKTIPQTSEMVVQVAPRAFTNFILPHTLAWCMGKHLNLFQCPPILVISPEKEETHQ